MQVVLVLEVHLMNRLARLGFPFSYGMVSVPSPFLPPAVHPAASAILVLAPYCCHFVYAACVKAKKKEKRNRKEKKISFLLCWLRLFSEQSELNDFLCTFHFPLPFSTASLFVASSSYRELWVMMAIIRLKQAGRTKRKQLTYPNRLWLKS